MCENGCFISVYRQVAITAQVIVSQRLKSRISCMAKRVEECEKCVSLKVCLNGCGWPHKLKPFLFLLGFTVGDSTDHGG